MKGILFCSTLGMFALLQASAQVTISADDMPHPGDSLRVSMTNALPVGFEQTAFDTVWDFSSLTPVTQRVEPFVAATAVPQEYWLVFIPSIITNLAAPANMNIPIPGFPVSSSYTFYNNTAVGFDDVGSAFKINGIPVTLKYDQPDRWYPFPLAPGMEWNSASSASLTIPSLAYISSERERTNEVDGWGTLVTPFGTFSTLRVKSELIQNDSISVESMGLKLSFPRHIIQYKWLAPGGGIPVLQINEELNMVSAIYRDSLRPLVNQMTVDLGPDTAVLKGQEVTLTPVVHNGVPPFRFIWSTFDTTQTLTLTVDSAVQVGVAAFDGLSNLAMDQVSISVKYQPGIGEQEERVLRIIPNPARGKTEVMLPEGVRDGVVTVKDIAGRELQRIPVSPGEARVLIDLSQLPAGTYPVTLTSGNTVYRAKLIIH